MAVFYLQREDVDSSGAHKCLLVCVWEGERERERNHPTLCKEKVRTQNVANSMVSNRVTWVIP